MHFLGGERDFITPCNMDGTIYDQVDQCFLELSGSRALENIYKLNFFIAITNREDYKKAQSYISGKIERTGEKEILLNIIAQAPLTSKVILEVFTYDPGKWQTAVDLHSLGKSILFSTPKTRFLLGSVQANGSHTRREQAKTCFSSIGETLSSHHFAIGDIIRQWNYIEDIVRVDGNNQNYQDFNDVRSEYYSDAFVKNGYPAATGIGMNEGGVIIEFIAMQSDEATSFAVDNPLQIAAHAYSENVMIGNSCNKTTPKFERARFLKYHDRQMMFISGTASILGEKTIGIGNPDEQTLVTASNIKKLYSEEILKRRNIEYRSVFFNHCRVYIKYKNDFSSIEKTCRECFGNIPMVFIQADICRNDLLVEIEGEVIL